MSYKESFKSIAINLSFLIITDVALAFVIALIWNTAGIWLVPDLSEMSYKVAIGLSTFFLFGDILIKYLINRWAMIKNAKATAKALEKLEVADYLIGEVHGLKQELKDKGIL